MVYIEYKGIAFVGTMKSGKTTTASIFDDVFGARVFSFATTLKQLCTTLYGMKQKDRSLLQGLGAAMRRINPDVFVDCLRTELNAHTIQSPWIFPVVDDVRYKNEFDFLQNQGFCMVYICRDYEKIQHEDSPHIVYYEHESEIHVKDLMLLCDKHIDNNTMSKSGLRAWVFEFARKHMALQHRIGYQFKNPDLLSALLTHYNRPGDDIATTFQSLKTVGDTVLRFVIADILFTNTAARTRVTNSVVNDAHLAKCAKQLGLHHDIKSITSEKLDSHDPCVIYADFLRAVLGAFWIDCKDLNMVERFAQRSILSSADAPTYSWSCHDIALQ